MILSKCFNDDPKRWHYIIDKSIFQTILLNLESSSEKVGPSQWLNGTVWGPLEYIAWGPFHA